MALSRQIRFYIYLSTALSSWGDRMWMFGVGMFMVIIAPDNLRVTAVFGLSSCAAMLLFGPLVGHWVDKTPRLRAARTSLVLQNTSVIICAGIIYVVITLKAKIQTTWSNEGLLYLCYAIIILIAIISNLASMATNIAVQKDWVVEICSRDKQVLATMTATLRRIDLMNSLVAPIATGQIMYYASAGIGALFIAGWNLVSVFVEYFLLQQVYKLCPTLARDKTDKPIEEEAHGAEELVVLKSSPEDVELHEGKIVADGPDQNQSKTMVTESQSEPLNDKSTSKEVKKSPELDVKRKTVCQKMFSGILILVRGWKIYMGYQVAFAGLGLASLYMTVLGFDNITIGYAYTQGINESIISIIKAVGAVSGILGTLLYPLFRKRIGLQRTGLLGFFLLVSFLCLCVGSIWAPGSPFDPLSSKPPSRVCNGTQDFQDSSLTNNNTIPKVVVSAINTASATSKMDLTTLGGPGYNGSVISKNQTGSAITGHEVPCTEAAGWVRFTSVALLLAGITGARCGLWMADLTITQLFMESIRENERGIVNGVQTSLNTMMDMLKFVLVIAIPQPELFGFLILLSFSFICIGWMLFAKYSHSARGHLFHFGKCSDRKNNNDAMAVATDASN
ncbi:solute carrier family 40 member 1-like isoform X2 [Dreissena polymorpha]|nr:solute carrier family 40 member 1-like isoform X2 [Dreissena polymorpha]XP_052286254.1 solute carrier family 40 member 1-like isoform X2 [Dreissena polymorpha]XP_052286265.1 solute carrier family 40 member 1-like isoform X2 [Dreissena polymorpha]XP_052286276.1 solute carrier family 40 member 1-like isoform X2 [Dreissena polymorpha]